MKTHKSKGKRQLEVFDLQVSSLLSTVIPQNEILIFLFIYFFFDEREIAFPRMLCLVGKAENQLSCHIGKHFISHHLNF